MLEITENMTQADAWEIADLLIESDALNSLSEKSAILLYQALGGPFDKPESEKTPAEIAREITADTAREQLRRMSVHDIENISPLQAVGIIGRANGCHENTIKSIQKSIIDKQGRTK